MIPNKSPSNEHRSKDYLKRGSNYQAKHFFLFKSDSYVYCSRMRSLNQTKDQLCAHFIGYIGKTMIDIFLQSTKTGEIVC